MYKDNNIVNSSVPLPFYTKLSMIIREDGKFLSN